VKLLKDLLFDATNSSLDWGRLVGVTAVLSVLIAAAGNFYHGKEIDIGPTGLPGGLATILAAASFYIIKDRQNANPKG
jgi:hypothetical protein